MDYLGEPTVYANGDNWEFRATHRETGMAKQFLSHTELGYFITAITYGPIVLIAADLGSGSWGFTVYDVDAERKVVEFWAGYPHLSPDGRYLLYRKFNGRNRLPNPGVVVLDLAREFGQVEIQSRADGFGETVFPLPPPPGRPELADAYRTTSAGWFGLVHVAWDMDNAVVYFPATDRIGHLSLVAASLEPVPNAVCQVPLTSRRVHSEYFGKDEVRVVPAGIELRSSSTAVVSTNNSLDVTADYRIPLIGACWEQNREFAQKLQP